MSKARCCGVASLVERKYHLPWSVCDSDVCKLSVKHAERARIAGRVTDVWAGTGDSAKRRSNHFNPRVSPLHDLTTSIFVPSVVIVALILSYTLMNDHRIRCLF